MKILRINAGGWRYLLPFMLLPAQAAMAEDVVWAHGVSVMKEGDALVKTSPCDGCSDAGAVSQQELGPPGGYVEFSVPDVGPALYAGLSNDRGESTEHGEIDYAIRVQNGMAEVRENDRYVTSLQANEGDRFRVAVFEGQVSYYRNDELVHESSASPDWPLGMDVALLGENARVADAEIVWNPDRGVRPGGREQASADEYEDGNFFWSNAVNVRVDERSVVKVDGCDGCEDAGATSRNTLERGNVHVEFTIPDVSKVLYVGVSNGHANPGFEDIDFAMRFQGGTAEIRENDEYKAEIEVRDGDRFRITVEDDEVSYWRLRGEELIHTSEQSPQYPLVVDTSLLSMDAEVANVWHTPF